MAVAGCFLLLVLPILGLLIGIVTAGAQGALWGAIAGFVIALAASGVMTYALVKASRRG